MAGTLAAAQPAAAKLDMSDWDRRVCGNDASTYEVGHKYRAYRARANCRTMIMGTDERRFVVVYPPSAKPRTRIPVLFFLHGTGGTGEQYWDQSRFRELAYKEGFVAVFPTSHAYDLNTDGTSNARRVWNIIGQACDLVDHTAGLDDVAFIRAIYEDLDSRLPLNRRRIHVAGFSNGGQMAHRVAAEAGDIFASAAAWAAIPAEGDGAGNQCAHDPVIASANPIPVWNGMGALDHMYLGRLPRLPLKPRLIERAMPYLPRDASALYSVAPTYSDTMPINQLVRVNPVGGHRPAWSPVMVYDPLPGNTAGNRYLFVILDGLGHKYPNAWPGRRFRAVTERSEGVTMAKLQYQYLRDNPKP